VLTFSVKNRWKLAPGAGKAPSAQQSEARAASAPLRRLPPVLGSALRKRRVSSASYPQPFPKHAPGVPGGVCGCTSRDSPGLRGGRQNALAREFYLQRKSGGKAGQNPQTTA